MDEVAARRRRRRLLIAETLLVQRLVQVRIVIADPCLKQIAKDMPQSVRGGLRPVKTQKPAVIAVLLSVQMQ